MKKPSIFGLLICFFMTSLNAQSLHHNIDTSLAIAKDEQKNILIIFSGSDWCKPCIQLKKSIINQQQFIQYSEDQLVLLEVDFPYRRKNKLPKEQQIHNEKLAEQYNKEGRFPKVILLNSERKLIGEVQYKKNDTPQEFIKQIQVLTSK